MVKSTGDLVLAGVILAEVVGEPYMQQIMHKPIDGLWVNMAVDELDLSISLDGRCEQQMLLPSHAVSIVAPGATVATRRGNRGRGFHVFLKSELVAEMAQEVLGMDLNKFEILSTFCFQDKFMSPLISSLRTELFELNSHSPLAIEHISRGLIVKILCNRTSIGSHTKGLVCFDKLSRTQEGNIDEYIRRNLSKNIGLGDLSRAAGVSRSILSRRFKNSFRQTPHQFIIEKRLQHAQKLLSVSNLSLVEIALMCGFSDQSHLCSTFRKRLGLTPVEFRRISRG